MLWKLMFNVVKPLMASGLDPLDLLLSVGFGLQSSWSLASDDEVKRESPKLVTSHKGHIQSNDESTRLSYVSLSIPPHKLWVHDPHLSQSNPRWPFLTGSVHMVQGAAQSWQNHVFPLDMCLNSLSLTLLQLAWKSWSQSPHFTHLLKLDPWLLHTEQTLLHEDEASVLSIAIISQMKKDEYTLALMLRESDEQPGVLWDLYPGMTLTALANIM